jgi:Lrp/AsnC family transcriptional regulator for asnA, asnC and gidA
VLWIRNQQRKLELASDSFAKWSNRWQNPYMSRTGRTMVSGLDELSKLIVEQLQQDGRKSYAEIGKAVGLSEAAVRQRVQKLTDKGVMQIVAVTDPMQLGFYTQAMIGIRCNGDTTNLANELSKLPEIDYVVITAGSFDILAEVVCENDDSLINLLNNKIRKFDGVTSTETFVYLKLQKQLYNWGTR